MKGKRGDIVRVIARLWVRNDQNGGVTMAHCSLRYDARVQLPPTSSLVRKPPYSSMESYRNRNAIGTSSSMLTEPL